MAVTRIHNPLSSGVDRIIYMTNPGTTGTVHISPESSNSDGSFSFDIRDRHVSPSLIIDFQPAITGSTGFYGPFIDISSGVASSTGTPPGTSSNDFGGVTTAVYYQQTIFADLQTNNGNDNYLYIHGSTAGGSAFDSAPHITAFGTDTDVDIVLAPKGSGVPDFNSWNIVPGGGAAATLGTIGGASGPTQAAQRAWLAIRVAGSTAYRFIPYWI